MSRKRSVIGHRIGEGDRILIVLLQGLGDLVISIPALRAIRARFPEARIDLLAPASHIEILYGQCGIDRCHHMPTHFWKDRPLSTLLPLARWLCELRRHRYALTIDLTTPLTPVSWLRLRALCALIGARSTARPSLSDCLYYGVPGTRWEFRVERNRVRERDTKFRFLRALFIPDTGEMPRLALPPEARSWVADFKNNRLGCGSTPLIGLCVGGSRPVQRYPLAKLATAIGLIDSTIKAIWIGVGTAEEATVFEHLQDCCDVRIHSAMGLSLQHVAGIIHACDAFLSNDTGLLHVAAAVNTPVMGIFGPGDLRRYPPLNEHAHTVSANVSCSPCQLYSCQHHTCMRQISPSSIASAVLSTLKTSRRKAETSARLRNVSPHYSKQRADLFLSKVGANVL